MKKVLLKVGVSLMLICAGVAIGSGAVLMKKKSDKTSALELSDLKGKVSTLSARLDQFAKDIKETITTVTGDIKETITTVNGDIKETVTDKNKIFVAYAPNSLKKTRDLPPAKLRNLPYPFQTYLTIASDVDSMTWSNSENVRKALKKMQLSLSDSTFIANNWSNGDKPTTPSNVTANIKDDEKFHTFLSWYHQGWFDTIHGMYDNTYLYYAKNHPTVTLTLKTSEQVIYIEKIHGNITEQSDKFLVFQYVRPTYGEFEISIEGKEGSWTVNSDSQLTKPFDEANSKFKIAFRTMPTTVVVPIKNFSSVNFQSDKIKVTVKAHSLGKDDEIVLSNICVSGHTATDLKDTLNNLNKFNVILPVFTHHTHPPHMTFGAEHHFADNRMQDRSWLPHVFGDSPQSPFYCIGHLDGYGVRYILPLHRTSQMNEAGIKPIDKLVTPFLFNDGQRRYAFERYYLLNDDTKAADGSWEEKLFRQVQGAMASSMNEGDGCIIYTHWGMNKEFSQNTLDALNTLKERYYGWSSTKGDLPLGLRIWVAPTSTILEYAWMVNVIQSQVRYDERNNSVHIFEATDPITGAPVPDSSEVGALNGLTVYVRDSKSAKAYIDNQEIHSFKRNPADLSGKESITLVDDSTILPIFNEVDFYQQGGKLWQDGASYTRHKTGSRFGQKYFTMTLLKEQARGIEWSPDALDSSGMTHFRFSYKKSNPKSAVKLVIEMDDQTVCVISEDERQANQKAVYFNMPRRDDGEWHDIVVDFADGNFNSFGAAQAPWGKVKKISFILTGKKNDNVSFDNVSFLRPNALRNNAGEVIVGGRIIPEDSKMKEGTTVYLRKDGKIYSTETNSYGAFYFPKVQKGGTGLVWAVGKNDIKFFPTCGREIDISRNIVDLDIKIPNDPRPDDLGGKSKYEPRYTHAQSEHVPKVGYRLRPGSIYRTTGLPDPVEFVTEIRINNLGFFDRWRAFENPDKSRRIMLLSTCLTYGHTEDVAYHPTTVLESELESITGQRFEVINFATMSQNLGTFLLYYDKFGQQFKPEIVVLEVTGSEAVVLGVPEYIAERDSLSVDHLPQDLMRLNSDGTLRLQEMDVKYLNYKDNSKFAIREKERKEKPPYIVMGFDSQMAWHKDLEIPISNELEKKVWDHFVASLKHYRDTFKKQNIKFIIAVNDAYDAFLPIERDGLKHTRENFIKRISKICSELGIPYVNIQEKMKEKYKDLIFRHWRRDTHYSRIGYRWYGEILADYFIETNFLTKL